MVGCSRVLYCVFTVLALSKFAICSENNGQRRDGEEKITYNGAQVLRVETVNFKQRKTIEKLENRGWIDKWFTNSTSVDIMVKKFNLEIVKNALINGSLSFEVLNYDIQRTINEENPPMNVTKLIGRKGHDLTYDRFYKINDIYTYVDNLSKEYPEILEVKTIGKTYENVPLRVIRIKTTQNSTYTKAIWIDGGIHAREWISVSSVLYLINELVCNRDSLESHMKNIEFHIIPVINPDGYKYSHEQDRLWRKNRNKLSGNACVGVDQNRNWNYHWKKSIPIDSDSLCSEIYSGTKPSSELETQAVVKYIMNNPNKFQGYLTFHSYGQYIMYPWGYAKLLPSDHKELDRVGQLMATAIKKATSTEYTVGSSAILLYTAAGNSFDWAKGVAKIKYSYGIELKDTGEHGFLLPPSEIISTGKEAFAAVSVLANEISSNNNNNA